MSIAEKLNCYRQRLSNVDNTVRLQVERTEQQRKAWAALSDDRIRKVLYGGAKGGGKSYLLCVWLFTVVWDIMTKAGLKPSQNPPHVAWFGRKQATDFAGTTLQTWREVIPEAYYRLRGGTERDPKHILIADRIAIDYGGLDKQEHINKFNSAEYIIIAIDQAEEVSKDEVAVLRGSLRMVLRDSKGHRLKIPYKEFYTANPRQCWLKDDFILNPSENSRFIPALPADNPYLPDDYLQTLDEAFGHRPELLRAYKEGDWSSIEDANQVILDAWVKRASTAPSLLAGTVISCDVARFGDDKTIIYYLNGTNIIERREMGYSRTTDVSDVLTEMSRVNDNCAIVVDEIGVGGGVIDELHKNGRHVIAFNSAAKATNPDKFYNLRAEAWWELGQHFAKSEIGCTNMNPSLRQELTQPTYDYRNGRVLIEAKDSIKKRLGRSTDEADCYVMGVWAIKRLRPALQFATSTQQSPYNNNLLVSGLRSIS